MKPVLVLFATREGHTRRIAERFGEVLALRGLDVELVNAADRPKLDASVYSAAVIAGSLHFGKHEKELVAVVNRNRQPLSVIPTLLLSVSLSAATLTRPGSSAKQREAARREIQGCIEGFAIATGLSFGRVEPVAGACLYRQYRFPVRLVMKLISGMAGGNTDTSRDWVYTDWAALEELATEWSALLLPLPAAQKLQEPNPFRTTWLEHGDNEEDPCVVERAVRSAER